MLVLTRRPGEQIVIGNGIRVTVVSVGPGRVKLGIEAPAHVRVDRQEVFDKIQQEQADHGSDVLAVVGQTANPDEASPTAVVVGEAPTRLHNRIADKLPAASDTPLSVPVEGIRKYRLPRKSR
jgi:carbon storage regulator